MNNFESRTVVIDYNGWRFRIRFMRFFKFLGREFGVAKLLSKEPLVAAKKVYNGEVKRS